MLFNLIDTNRTCQVTIIIPTLNLLEGVALENDCLREKARDAATRGLDCWMSKYGYVAEQSAAGILPFE